MSLAAQSADFDQQLQLLLDRCAAADASALERLYELASPFLFACLTRMLRRRALAEEALQDVFVSIWQRAGQFQSARGLKLSRPLPDAHEHVLQRFLGKRAPSEHPSQAGK